MNRNRDSAGRLTSLTDAAAANYVSSITYSVAGYRNGWTLGNGVVETFTHDTNRGFLASQSAIKTGSTLLSLSYSYQAAAGQSGAGTTAGNGHQMISISGSIGGLTESASYTYDLQKRLLTSNQTTNGTSAQRRFAYDRWGNRTTTHDAVSGGTQIQTITLQQSGGIPSNRISSVNNGGSFNYTYSYDNAGNVTNDGLHTYIYDAENRLVSVDNGTTAQYGYNYKNQRIKKTGAGGSITRYVWENDKVIAEYDGSTGALNAEQIFYEDVPICKEQSGRVYFLSDKLSIRAILDTNGNIIGRQAHLPFGEEMGGSGTQDKRHLTSYETDSESSTDYALNRHYAQSVGRFMSADPYKTSEAALNPQKWNRYSYVLNDPIHNHDSKGLFEEGPSYEEICSIFGVPPRAPIPEPYADPIVIFNKVYYKGLVADFNSNGAHLDLRQERGACDGQPFDLKITLSFGEANIASWRVSFQDNHSDFSVLDYAISSTETAFTVTLRRTRQEKERNIIPMQIKGTARRKFDYDLPFSGVGQVSLRCFKD